MWTEFAHLCVCRIMGISKALCETAEATMGLPRPDESLYAKRDDITAGRGGAALTQHWGLEVPIGTEAWGRRIWR